MSIEAMTAVLHHSRATGSAKLLLLGIANHQGDSGAWPSIQTLTKYTGSSKRYVQKMILELVELGDLAVDYQDGIRGTNRYWVTVTCPEDCDRSTAHRQGGELWFMGGVNYSSRGGMNYGSPEPSLEPSMKSKRRGTRLSEDFAPTPDMFEWAAKEHPNVDAQLETKSFIDYWLSTTKNAVKTDWDRTWKNWIRNCDKRLRVRGPRQSAIEQNIEVIRQMKELGE